MSESHTPYHDAQPLPVEAQGPSRAAPHAAVQHPSAPIADEAWDVFELDEDTIEPEYGDFWGELDDDETI